MLRTLSFGLGLLLFATMAVADDPKDKPKSDPPGAVLEARIVLNKDTYALNLGGKTADEFRKAVKEAETKGGAAPGVPPEVDIVVELRNTSEQDIKIWVEGDNTELILDLKGPGAASYTQDIPIGRATIPSKVITIAAGKTHTLPLKSLQTGTSNIRIQRTYWTETGEYTLVARYRTAIAPAPKGAKDAGDALGHVVVSSAPVKIQVK
jgi:hypothetical protein